VSLADTDYDTVQDWLTTRLAGQEYMRSWLIALVPHPLFGQRLDLCHSAPEYAAAALRLAVAEGNDYEPPWTIRLLRGLPETEEVLQMIDRVQSAVRKASAASPHNPLATQRLHHGGAFLDRKELRNKIEKLLLPARKNFLVVNGPKQSGKSYTSSYIEFLCRQSPAVLSPEAQGPCFGHALIELEADDRPSYGAEELAIDLVSKMERPSTPPEALADSRERELVRWVFEEAAETGMRWWWVFDGFCGDDMVSDTRKLLQRLLRRVAEGGPAAKRIRIALIDYPDDLPDQVRAMTEYDTVQPPSTVGDLYVREYFEEFFRDKRADDDVVQFTTKDVLQDLPCDTTRLRELRMRIDSATERLMAGPNGTGASNGG
jgi:hypothetical protein